MKKIEHLHFLGSWIAVILCVGFKGASAVEIPKLLMGLVAFASICLFLWGLVIVAKASEDVRIGFAIRTLISLIANLLTFYFSVRLILKT